MTAGPQKILPPHPWTIATGYKAKALFAALALLVVAAAILAAVLSWQGGHIGQLREEQSIWDDESSRETDAGFRGTRSSTRKSLTNTYKLDVEFVVDDEPISKHFEFETFGRLDERQDVPVVVRYDPKNPQRCALNLAVDKSVGRWGAALLYGGIFAFIGVALGLVGLRKLSFYRYVRSLETRGVELHCKLVTVEEERDGKGNPTNRSIYRVRIPTKKEDPRSPFATAQSGAFILPNRVAPLEVGDAGDQVVVLLPADAVAVPDPLVGLQTDFYPLTLTEAQKRVALGKLVKTKSV